MLTQLHGDCLDLLQTLDPGSVQTAVTSPPYYGLRDYGLPPTLWPTVTYRPMPGLPPVTIPGCDPDCDHEWGDPIRAPWANEIPGPNGRVKNPEASRGRGKTSGERCQRCGGWRGCLGLEPDPLMYVGHLVLIFRHLGDALAKDGTAWLNLGDSYAGGGNGGGGSFAKDGIRTPMAGTGKNKRPAWKQGGNHIPDGLKNKDLLGIPWRAAFALQADGWYLRAENIWNKPNCMPESVDDRTTRAHEQVFLLAKSKRYYYDAEAVAEEAIMKPQRRLTAQKRKDGHAVDNWKNPRILRDEPTADGDGSRNRRTVWTISTTPYPGAHYAVMPEALADICIKAGSRPGDTVLDPFGGSGTVGRRALALGRHAVLMDLNADYLTLQDERTATVQMELDAA
jgi:DNA modification methylase